MATLEQMRARFAPRASAPKAAPPSLPAAPPSPASAGPAATPPPAPEAPDTRRPSSKLGGGGVDMTKLRASRAGKAAPVAPPRAPRPAEDGEAMERKARYTLTPDGRDATLHFGKYAEQRISEMAKSGTSAGYLRWMQGKEFPAELITVINRYV